MPPPPEPHWFQRVNPVDPRPAPPSVVYFVEHGTLVKIGYSTNLAQRLKAVPGRLVATIPGTMADEAALHQRFARLREYAEWFRNEPPLTDYLAALGGASGRCRWCRAGSFAGHRCPTCGGP